MHIFSLRRIFRALHGVKYTSCETCGEPISSSSSLHSCNPQIIPLAFYYTKLTESSRSIHFYDRTSGRGYLHEIKIWTQNYISGVELNLEDLDSKKHFHVRRGESTGKMYRICLDNGEFIQKIEYGCDFHGIYYLGFFTDRQEVRIGDLARPKKSIFLPEGFGLVGLFGGHTDIILHLGFYYDNISEVNWKRHKELMLIRNKGKEIQGNVLSVILRLDDSLFRYLAAFV